MRPMRMVPLLGALLLAGAACGSKGTGDNSDPAQQVPSEARPTGGAEANHGGDVTSGTEAGSSTTVDTSATSNRKSGGDTAKTAGRP
jgi:hypothetical protein